MAKVGTLEWKKSISRALSGKKNPMFGKRHSKSTLAKISQKLRGKKNPMFGRRHTLETLEKMSAVIKKTLGKFNRN